MRDRTSIVNIAIGIAALAGFISSFPWMSRYDRMSRLGLKINRSEAEQIAARFAAEHGVDLAARTAYIKISGDDDVLEKLDDQADNPMASIPATVLVIFANRSWEEKFAVRLTASGEVDGFRDYSPHSAAPPIGESAARSLALGAARHRFGQTFAQAPDTTETIRRGKQDVRRFTWVRHGQGSADVDLVETVEVTGAAITADESALSLTSQAKSRVVSVRTAQIRTTLAIFLLIVPSVLYAGYRYIVRAREREVPHLRALGVLLFTLSLISITFFTVDDGRIEHLVTNNGQTRTQFLGTLIVMAFLFSLTTLLAWGGCEGDIRETHPGKLTSLDALMARRFASPNVARSFLTGAGWAGTMTLLTASLGFLLGHPSSSATAEGVVFMSRAPILSALAGPGVGATQLILLGLLIPLSILSRWRLTGRHQFVLAFLGIGLFFFASLSFLSPGLAAALAAILAATMVGSFRLHDLLTTGFAMWLAQVHLFAVRLFLQPHEQLHRDGIALLALLMAAVVIAAFRVRGRQLMDEEVRPLYAHNLAERLALQAEVSTAREVQRRLLPRELPAIQGMSIAGRCEPAHEVGGDYYDALPLPDGRFALVLVDDTSGGISAALLLGLVKGLLLAYTRRFTGALELVTRVRSQLRKILGSGTSLAMIVAVVDPERRIVEHARIGPGPRLLVRSTYEKKAAIAPPVGEEIAAGELVLEPGDTLYLLSDSFEKEPSLAETHALAALEKLFDSGSGAGAAGDRTAIVLHVEERP